MGPWADLRGTTPLFPIGLRSEIRGLMINRIKKFRELSSDEKKLFLEAYMTVGIMRAAILRVPFKWLTRSLAHHKNDIETIPLDDGKTRIALLVGKAISRASAYTFWESTCLAQSFTARRMLQKRGISGVFYLGVAKDLDGTENIKAHSWSQCGDVIITGDGGHRNFTILSVFGWTGN